MFEIKSLKLKQVKLVSHFLQILTTAKFPLKTITIISGLLLIIPQAKAQSLSNQNVTIEQHLNNVIAHLVGVMDTSRQALINPQKSNVRMTTCLINISSSPTNHYFLYQEQALSDRLNQPYRQRFLEIFPSNNNQEIISRSYKPEKPEQLKGLCNQPEAKRNLNSNNLGAYVCQVILTPMITIYRGETPPEGCPANVRGAVKITNTIILHNWGMDTWDRGFDAQGNQVWGAENESYQFRWLHP